MDDITQAVERICDACRVTVAANRFSFKEIVRAELLAAEQRGAARVDRYGGMLASPCAWCGYNGAGFWQTGTHDGTCPWHVVGGYEARHRALREYPARLAAEQRGAAATVARRIDIDVAARLAAVRDKIDQALTFKMPEHAKQRLREAMQLVTEQPQATQRDHICQRPRTCCCNSQALEPDETCPIHGAGEWPPRCEICGRLMKWPKPEQGGGVLAARTVAIVGGGDCGFCYIEVPDSIDSGSTFRCVQCGKPIVFDVASPETRAAFYAATTRIRDVAQRARGLLAAEDGLRENYGPIVRDFLRELAEEK